VLHTDTTPCCVDPPSNELELLDSGARASRHVRLLLLQRGSAGPSVTLNGTSRIDPRRSSRFDYAHPILDRNAIEAQRDHARIDGEGGIHYCGAHWRWGFHEDGLESALRVVRSIERSS
jgi:predicted NAD/FAD-binding protein